MLSAALFTLCRYVPIVFSLKKTHKNLVLVSLFNYNQACFKCYFRCESIFLNLVPLFQSIMGTKLIFLSRYFLYLKYHPLKLTKKDTKQQKVPQYFLSHRKALKSVLFLKTETKAQKSLLKTSCKKTPQPQIYKSAAASHIGKPQRLIILL